MASELPNHQQKEAILDEIGDVSNNSNVSSYNCDAKARSYEYGDALISRDVTFDEIEHKISTLQTSEGTRLPIVDNKWGVNLRHVITREESTQLDDKNEKITQEDEESFNLQNLLKNRPRSTLIEETSNKSTKFNKMCRSQPSGLLSTNDEHRDTFTGIASVLQRMKNFEFKSTCNEKSEKTVELGKETYTIPNKFSRIMSLEDLLNYDKNNLCIDVVDKSRNPIISSENKMFDSTIRNDKNGIINCDLVNPNNSASEKNSIIDISLPEHKKENLNNHSQKIDSKHSTRYNQRKSKSKDAVTIGKKCEDFKHNDLYSTEKRTGKSWQVKKFISLDELLKLDELNLSIDVIEKSKLSEKSELSKNKFSKSEDMPVINVYHPLLECDQDVKVIDKNDSVSEKEIVGNDFIELNIADIKELDFRTSNTKLDKGNNKVILAEVNGIEEVILNCNSNIDNKVNDDSNYIKSEKNHYTVLQQPKTSDISCHPDIKCNDVGEAMLSKDGNKLGHTSMEANNNIDTFAYNSNENVNNCACVTMKEHDKSCMVLQKLPLALELSKNAPDIKPSSLENDSKTKPVVNNPMLKNTRKTEDCLNVYIMKNSVESKPSLNNEISNNEPGMKQFMNNEKFKNPCNITFSDNDLEENNITTVPQRCKVGKLVIMTGEQRNEQVKNKNKNLSLDSKKMLPVDKSESSKNENIKKSHLEGFSLTFISNELEDDGIPDDYPVPEIIFNEEVVGLKSSMHTSKNIKSKYVFFNPTKLITIHSYEDEESLLVDDNDGLVEPKADKVNNSESQIYSNTKAYVPNNSIDFGSVIQRERQRFNAIDDNFDNSNTYEKNEPDIDTVEEGGYFNSKYDQDGGQALLF